MGKQQFPSRSALLSLFAAALLMIGGQATQAEDLLVLPDISIATSVARADSDKESPGSPVVGFDGTNYLVVHREMFSGTTTLMGSTISPSGILLNQFIISDQVEGRFPALGFNGTNFLLTFNHETDIFGLFIHPSGQVIGTNTGFRITPPPNLDTHYYSAVAFDGTNFLVVWQKHVDPRYRIYGTRVTANGTVLGEFLISSASNAEVSPKVAFDGHNYLVVWCRETYDASFTQQSDIRGARVSPAGIVLDSPSFPISTAAHIQDTPAIAFDGTNYLVAWFDQRSNPDDLGNRHIYATRISTNGALLDGTATAGGIPVDTAWVENKTGLGACFDGRDFFITWWLADHRGGNFATRVSSAGVLLNGTPESAATGLRVPDCYACQVAYAPAASNGQSVLVPWLLNAELGGTFKEIRANVVVSSVRIAKPKIKGAERVAATGALQISFDTWNGVPYQVQQSSDLVTWQNIGSEIPGTGETVQVVVGQPSGQQRSFRVKVATP